jgi:formiminotetrahydrofolate cyclodeaminase
VLSLPTEELLAKLARGTRVPGAGPAAALVTAIGAALAAMAARSSVDSWADARAAVAQAESLRARAGRLAEEDAEALEAFLAAREATAEPRREARDFTIGQALDRAADVPLAIAEAACDVAQLAAHVVDHCEGDVRADAASAAALALGAARAAAHLVEVNLAMAEGDVRVLSARNLVRLAEEAADSAVSDQGHSE